MQQPCLLVFVGHWNCSVCFVRDHIILLLFRMLLTACPLHQTFWTMYMYRIYSINRPGRLSNFWTLRVGAYSRWALIRGWALIKFLPFLASEVCLFCYKTVNANNKTRRSNKARFLYNTLKKTLSSGKSLIRIFSLKWVGWGWALIWVLLGGGRGGRLFEAGHLLTFSAFRMGAFRGGR